MLTPETFVRTHQEYCHLRSTHGRLSSSRPNEDFGRIVLHYRTGMAENMLLLGSMAILTKGPSNTYLATLISRGLFSREHRFRFLTLFLHFRGDQYS